MCTLAVSAATVPQPACHCEGCTVPAVSRYEWGPPVYRTYQRLVLREPWHCSFFKLNNISSFLAATSLNIGYTICPGVTRCHGYRATMIASSPPLCYTCPYMSQQEFLALSGSIMWA